MADWENVRAPIICQKCGRFARWTGRIYRCAAQHEWPAKPKR